MAIAASEMLDDVGTARVYPLNIELYHWMIAQGFLPEGEPYELLNGLLVHKERHARGQDPMTVGKEHSYCVDALNELNGRLRRLGCYLRVQQPIVLPPHNEPEPDGAIVLGTKETYRERKPTAEDVLSVIEVSDASLRRDRIAKLRIYADGGIRQYVIISIPERAVEVHTEPLVGSGHYGRSITIGARGSVVFPAPGGKELRVAVRRLLP